MAGARDEARAEQFAERMLDVVNHSFVALLTSIGHRTGLFDTLAALPHSTSEQIATAAGLDERYVREWLAGMTVGGIVEYAPEDGTYALPAEHAAFLTRAAGPDNIAVLTQYVSCMGEVEDGIVECFRRGGGLPYSAYERFHAIMMEDSGQVFDATLLTSTLDLMPGMRERLSAGIDVLDVGCGSGRAVHLLAREFPHSRVTGYDFSEEAVGRARREAADLGLANATFVLTDVAEITDVAAFDLITAFDTIHDQAHPDRVLAGIARALRDDGTFLMVDIGASSNVEDNLDHPLGPFLYGVSTMHCMSVSLGLGGMGLGTMWGEQRARAMLDEAGLDVVRVQQVEGDIANSFYVARKRR
ncbi:MAG TPA: class I SAM-dependent methyltransferase [Egibacteraceae bacterium]|jgi:SAM-dependent methyltransferase|nr:class I SAM-dependent methyltransferase [Egibacteraceae bacterium]